MISNTYANSILNAMFGLSDAVSVPTTLYLGLCSTEPDAATGTVTSEPTEESYARVPVGGSSATKMFANAASGKITNSKEIHFPTARTAWGDQSYWFISSSASGAAIMWGALTETLSVGAETVPTFYEGDLVASIDVPLSE